MNTKLFRADCQNGKVTANGVDILSVDIASAGRAKSTGHLLLNGPDAVYIAIPIESIKDLIRLTSSLVQAVASGVKDSNGGGSITTPTFVAELANIKVQLEELKEALQ